MQLSLQKVIMVFSSKHVGKRYWEPDCKWHIIGTWTNQTILHDHTPVFYSNNTGRPQKQRLKINGWNSLSIALFRNNQR